MCLLADNVGQNRLCGLYGLGCKHPCRFCHCKKSELLNPSSSQEPIRDSSETVLYLKGAFGSFIRKMKKIRLNPRDLEVLKYCEDRSIEPLNLAVMNVDPPFQGFSAYEYFRPDYMHTILGRLKTWCFTTVVICHRVSSLFKGEFANSLANLDDALINFLPNHSLPFQFHHFQEGVTLFCLASTDSKRSKLSTSGLGKIDYSRMKSLVIQMLISNFNFTIKNVFILSKYALM